MPAPKEVRTEPVPMESYYSRIKDLFDSFEQMQSPLHRKRPIENGEVDMLITEREEFLVSTGAFSYYIGQQGVYRVDIDLIEIGEELKISPAKNLYIPEDPGIKRTVTEELVSWTERMISENTILEFPFQPNYRSERRRQ